MYNFLLSTVGNPGPLFVENNKKIFIEPCMTISSSNVMNMILKIKDISFTKIEQTTDRSFLII